MYQFFLFLTFVSFYRFLWIFVLLSPYFAWRAFMLFSFEDTSRKTGAKPAEVDLLANCLTVVLLVSRRWQRQLQPFHTQRLDTQQSSNFEVLVHWLLNLAAYGWLSFKTVLKVAHRPKNDCSHISVSDTLIVNLETWQGLSLLTCLFILEN